MLAGRSRRKTESEEENENAIASPPKKQKKTVTQTIPTQDKSPVQVKKTYSGRKSVSQSKKVKPTKRGMDDEDEETLGNVSENPDNLAGSDSDDEAPEEMDLSTAKKNAQKENQIRLASQRSNKKKGKAVPETTASGMQPQLRVSLKRARNHQNL